MGQLAARLFVLAVVLGIASYYVWTGSSCACAQL